MWMGQAGHMDGKWKFCSVSPMEQLVLRDKWARKNYFTLVKTAEIQIWGVRIY